MLFFIKSLYFKKQRKEEQTGASHKKIHFSSLSSSANSFPIQEKKGKERARKNYFPPLFCSQFNDRWFFLNWDIFTCSYLKTWVPDICWIRRLWGFLPLRSRSSRDNVWWTNYSPHFPPPLPAGWRRERNSGVKLSPGRREAEDIFKICFDFSTFLLWFEWLYIKLTSLRWVCLVMVVTGEWSLPAFISIHKIFILFSLYLVYGKG